MTFLFTRRCLAILVLWLSGCGGGSVSVVIGGDDERDDSPPLTRADITLLFMGNSHMLVNDVPALVTALVRAAVPGRSVAYAVAPGSMLLDERLNHRPSTDLLGSQRWSAVILQAQRYSSSGTVTYSTDEAEELVRRSRLAGAMPVMFPEWPRRGIDESARIFGLHLQIARTEPACVPPIPQAFDIARAQDPTLDLHAADGNHSSPSGALLAALLIATTITGQLPAAAHDLTGVGVDPATQARLRTAATEAIRQTSPWTPCPADRPG